MTDLIHDLVSMGCVRFNLYGRAQIEGREYRPEAVVTHVRDRTTPEVIPTAKNSVRIIRMIWSIERGAKPQIPIKAFRDRRLVGWETLILRPHRPVSRFLETTQ